jgi:putative tryptophan/tyrosine transport system substrate-binding protein
MQRREFITLLGSVAAWPLAARAQQSAMPVIGFLLAASSDGYAAFVASFREGLKETGYVEGKNVTVDYRWAEGQNDRLPAMADDLVRRQVAVIVASGGDAPGLAAKKATDKIPIVFISGGAPVKAGLVASLNRPGGNITGVSFIVTELIPKRLELLHELVPKAVTIGALVNPSYADAELQLKELQEAAAATGLHTYIVNAGTQRDIDAAFTTLVQQGVDTLLVANDPFFQSRRDQIIALAARHAIAASYSGREFVDAGGLMSYGPSLMDAYRLAGSYTGKVLNGTKPADLPVEQPTKFDFAINIKTAKALGLDVPLHLQQLADEVIE